MELLSSCINLLKKPFPEEEGYSFFFKIIILFSFFITLFLYIFQPFGIADIEAHKFWICLGFGSMTFLGATVYEFTVGLLLRWLGFRTNWTFYKWILYNLGVVFFISFFNFLFIRLAFFGFIQWELFPIMLYGTFMIGLIPFTILGGVIMSRQEHKYQGISKEINQKKEATSTNHSEKEVLIFQIAAPQIRYIEALQNYIKIGFINAEGQLSEQIERSTLKQAEVATEGTSIVRCHRSFMVNQAAIISTSGNAQGLLLTLSNCKKPIPVSRRHVSIFR